MKKIPLCLFILAVLTPLSHANDQELSEAYGMVQKIDGNQMTVAVFNPANNEMSDVTFSLTPDTQLVIVRPATEVIEGDEVKINFTENKKDKTAQYISILDLPAPGNA